MHNSDKIMSNPNNKIYNKNSFHWRNDSGELDVFEAARYFNDHVPPYINAGTRPARRSLDMPIMRSIPPHDQYHHHQIIDQKQISKDQNKKFKQPSSPGGRLASFLNSLFNQTSLKKKKKSSKSSSAAAAAAVKDFEEGSPGGGRRKRRSSISHFGITTTAKTAAAAAAAAEDKGSGFRTPPPYAITPTKSYKELARLAAAVPKKSLKQSLVDDHHGGEKLRVKFNGGKLRKLMMSGDEDDDGGESDSSSDLFDLPNHDLDLFGSSLPVYETTHMERIRIPTN